MDAESQKRKIRRFIKGAIKDGIDPFCIYQWIERCHFEGWWEMGVALGSQLQPNSLNRDYEKRLEVLLKECRIKQGKLNGKKSDGPIMHSGRSDRRPIRKIIRGPGSPPGSHTCWEEELQFDNEAKQTLRQIYSVLYYMQRNHDFIDAVRHTKDNFNIAYQSVDDKCARRFAGTVEIFQRWYRSGEILQRLKNHFHLNHHDYRIFEELLINTSKRDL